MTPTCCISNCLSGRSSDSENKRQLYRFPKDEKSKSKWLAAIGDCFREEKSNRKTFYLCSKHFEESCFVREPLEIWKDGTQVQIQRKRSILKKGSVPSIFPFEKSIEHNYSVNPSGVVKPVKSVKTVKSIYKRELSPNSERRLAITKNIMSIQDSTPISQPNLRTPVCTTDSSVSSIIQIDGSSEHNYSANHSGVVKSVKSVCKRQLSPNSERRLAITNNIMSIQSSTPISQPSHLLIPMCTTDSCLPIEIIVEQYSKAALIKDWHARDVKTFPEYWGLTESIDGIFFGYVGDTSCTVTRAIVVKEDMTVEIRAHNQIAKFPVLEKVYCLEDVRSAMMKILCLKICEMALKGQCSNGFYLPKSSSASNKCKQCQMESRRKKNSEQRTARRLLLKKKKDEKVKKNLRQKLSRTVKKVGAMQKCIDHLMNHCSTIDEKLLEEGTSIVYVDSA